MKQELTAFLLPGKLPPPSARAAYEDAFALWTRVWSETLRELDGADRIFSDEFTRQDEVLSISKDGRCVALVCHRFVDFRSAASRSDSYFRSWPDDAILRLQADGPLIVIGSQITIHPDFRKSSGGESLKTLLAAVSLLAVKSRKPDAIAGTMRADKGMHRLFYELGAEPLKRDVIFHNVPVDLVAFFPRRMPEYLPERVRGEAEALWVRAAVELKESNLTERNVYGKNDS